MSAETVEEGSASVCGWLAGERRSLESRLPCIAESLAGCNITILQATRAFGRA